MKICSLYGAGFYYIPGTDMCLKIGGWVRFEASTWNNGSSTTSVNGDVNNRGTSNLWWRHRGYITADARNQTEYGTVRSYLAVGLSTNTNGADGAANQFDANRAFIQFAGFTFGRTQSFFDEFSGAASGYNGQLAGSDTGDGGWGVAAYTAQFGGGWSATISAEARRMTQIINQGVVLAAPAAGALVGGSFIGTGTSPIFPGYGGWQIPDIIGNLRVDQVWGDAQVMGALHEVNAPYYTNGAGALTGLENNGHPNDAWGFAVGAGLLLKTPMIAPGDYLDTQIVYTQGAPRYLFMNLGGGNPYVQTGQKAGYGVLSDAVYGGTNAGGATTGTSLQLTTGWGVLAHYEHIWNPHWQTSVYGTYTAISYNTLANAILCVSQGQGNGAFGNGAVAAAGCNNNYQMWQAGTRTQWNIDASTYMGLDLFYGYIQSASSSTGLVPASQIPATTATTGQVVSNIGNFTARFRVHRNFYP